MYKYSFTNKWANSWFVKLTSNSKVLFLYIIDNCDIAGFYDVDLDLISKHTGLSQSDVKHSFKEIRKTFVIGKPKNKIWLRNYLHYQKKLPLDLETNEGQEIYSVLNKNINSFYATRSLILQITSQAETLIGKRQIKYPTYNEFKSFYLSEKNDADEKDIQKMYGYYNGINWETQNGKKITNWKSYIKSRILYNEEIKNNSNHKIKTHISSVEKIKGIDFNNIDYD